MQVLKSRWFIVVVLSLSSFFLQAEKVCRPDQSIENQRSKKISLDAQALLAKIIHDKITLDWPVEVCKCWVSSLFGQRASGFHNGVDFAASKGTPVYAAAHGYVELLQESLDPKGYGNMLLLNHGDSDYKTRYAHLDSLCFQENKKMKCTQQGDKVKKGQQIGTVGATGHVISKKTTSDPSHLHFEVYRGKSRINPLIALFAGDPAWVTANK